MEKLLFLLFPLIAFSSITSAGNDENKTSTAPTRPAFSSPSSNDSVHEISTEKPVSSTFLELTTTRASETVSSTTAPLSYHTGTTDGSNFSLSSTSGQSIITTSLTLMTPKSTDTTPNAISSSGTKTTVGVSVHPKTFTSIDSNISVSEAPTQAPDSSLTLLAFGVMSLILILIVVMVILVTTINLRGKCKAAKEHEGIKSCESVISDSNMTSNGDRESITLVSVRTINTDNNTDSPQISSVRSTIVDNEDQEFTRDLLGLKDGL